MDHRSMVSYNPWRFFALVGGLSLPFWGLGAVTTHLAARLPIQLPTSALMAVCPAAAALILVHREGGKTGIHTVLRRALAEWHLPNPWWYGPTILLMPAVALASVSLARVLGWPLPRGHTPLGALPIFVVLFGIGAAGEEIGWTGYATEPMQERWGAFGASLILGVVWALWHVVPNLQAGRTLAWIGWQSLATVALRVLLVWLFNVTGRRIWPTILFHAMINVSVFFIPIYGSGYNPQVTAAILTGLAASITLVWGPTTLAERRSDAPPA